MAYIPTERPFHIAGQTAILVPDYVGPKSVLSDHVLIEEATFKHDRVWMSEAEIARMREQHPNVPVFGLLQVLLHNDLIPATEEFVVVQANNDSGLFVRSEDQRIVESGIYIGPNLPNPYDQALVGYLPQIELDERALSLLRLPPQQARLAAEIARIQERANRRRMIVLATAATAVLVLGVLVDQVLDARDKSHQAEAGKLHEQASALIERTNINVKNRDTRLPGELKRQEAVLTRLAELYFTSDRLQMEATRIDGGQFKATTYMIAPGLSFPIQANPSPTGIYELTWSQDGAGDQMVTSAAGGKQ